MSITRDLKKNTNSNIQTKVKVNAQMMANYTVSVPNNIGATTSVALETDQSLKLVSSLVEGISEKDVVPEDAMPHAMPRFMSQMMQRKKLMSAIFLFKTSLKHYLRGNSLKYFQNLATSWGWKLSVMSMGASCGFAYVHFEQEANAKSAMANSAHCKLPWKENCGKTV